MSIFGMMVWAVGVLWGEGLGRFVFLGAVILAAVTGEAAQRLGAYVRSDPELMKSRWERRHEAAGRLGCLAILGWVVAMGGILSVNGVFAVAVMLAMGEAFGAGGYLVGAVGVGVSLVSIWVGGAIPAGFLSVALVGGSPLFVQTPNEPYDRVPVGMGLWNGIQLLVIALVATLVGGAIVFVVDQIGWSILAAVL